MSDLFIRKLEAFGPLPNEDKRALEQAVGSTLQVDAGHDLVREGDLRRLAGPAGRKRVRSRLPAPRRLRWRPARGRAGCTCSGVGPLTGRRTRLALPRQRRTGAATSLFGGGIGTPRNGATVAATSRSRTWVAHWSGLVLNAGERTVDRLGWKFVGDLALSPAMTGLFA